MVLCEHCHTKNSLDSQFCKSCGREVNETVRQAAREENAKLISEGYVMLGEGRTDEAALLARAVLEAEPNSAGGHSLQGMVCERMGDLVGALESYEKVVLINPDSTLDKIKVQQLRTSLTRQISDEPKPNRRTALAAAAASVVFMAAAGAIIATVMTRPAQAAEQPPVDSQLSQSNSSPFSGRPITVANNDNKLDPGSVQAVKEPTQMEGTPNVSTPGGLVNPRGNNGNSNRWRYDGNATNGVTLPGTGRASEEQEVKPAYVPEDIRIEPTRQADPNEPGLDGGQNRRDPEPEVKVDSKPKYVIEITERKGETVGGSETVGGGGNENGAEAAMRAAREQQQTKDWKGAASSLERARSMGRDDGSTNQRLGNAYERSGKKDQAVEAYKRAVTQLEKDAKAGKAGAKEKLESTKQALKNIQGKGG